MIVKSAIAIALFTLGLTKTKYTDMLGYALELWQRKVFRELRFGTCDRQGVQVEGDRSPGWLHLNLLPKRSELLF